MKKLLNGLLFIFGIAVIGSFPFNAHAQSNYCLSGTKCSNGFSLFENTELYGWVQGGIYTNTRGNTVKRERDINDRGHEKSYLVSNSGNSDLLSSVHLTDFQINQLWGGIKKTADGSNGLDWGYGAEIFFGPEAWFCQSWNDASFDYGWQYGDYYLSMPQLYFELAYGDLSLKLGKFETILGGESLRAPDFFFYSHSHLFMMEPYSHTGGYFEYTPNDRLTLGLGYVSGGDSGFENKFDDHGILGQISYQFTKKLNVSYSFKYTKYSNQMTYINGAPRAYAGRDYYFHTLLLEYDVNEKLSTTLQWNYGDAKDRKSKDHAVMYGLASSWIYTFNPCWGVGLRVDWANDDEFAGFYDGDVWGATLCLNWHPRGCENISIRPEIRYDRASSNNYVFNDGRSKDQMSGGVCFVYKF